MQTTSLTTSPLFTSIEAANYLRISRTTLYRLKTEGCVRSISLGTRTPYFLRSDLDQYIDDCLSNR